ncbi:MAG: HEAT repeat domain-containing protein [bacterium]
MKLSKTQIIDGIGHEEQLVRDQAVRYFAGAYAADTAPLLRAIEIIERYGWQDAFAFSHTCARLAHSEPTIRWTIEQLEESTGSHEDRDFWLGRSLVGAPLELLLPHRDRIDAIKHLAQEHKEHLAERVDLAELKPDDLWDRLEEFCQREKDKFYVNDVDLPHAFRLVEALGRHDSAADRALDILVDESEPAVGDPRIWMEALAVRLAGELRLKQAIAMLGRRFQQDVDWLREECTGALAKIGTEEAVDALCEQIPDSEWHVRLFAAGALEKQRGESVVPRCLELLDSATDGDIRNNLLRAALANFDTEAVHLTEPGSCVQCAHQAWGRSLRHFRGSVREELRCLL